MKIAKLVLLVLCLVILGFVLLKAQNSFAKKSQVQLVFQDSFAPSLKERISNFYNAELRSENVFNAIVQLKNKFPEIQSFTIKKTIDGNYIVVLRSQTPVKSIDNNLVLTSDLSVFKKSDFVVEAPLDISTALKDSELDNELRQFLKIIPHDVFDHYDIIVHSKYAINFVVKNSTLFAVCASYLNLVDSDYLNFCTQLMQEKSAASKRKSKLVADIRFKDQIILR